MELSRQEYWSGLPLPSPEDLPNPGIKPRSPTLQADSLPAEPQGKPRGRNPEKAFKELGWKAQFGIEEMCRDAWNWQKQNPHGYKG